MSSALLTVPPLPAHMNKPWGLFAPSSLGSCFTSFQRNGPGAQKVQVLMVSPVTKPMSMYSSNGCYWECPPEEGLMAGETLMQNNLVLGDCTSPNTWGTATKSGRKFPCCCPQLSTSGLTCNSPLSWDPSPAPHCVPLSSFPLANNPIDKKGRLCFVVALLILS